MDADCTGSFNCYRPSGTNGVLSTSTSSFAPAYAATIGWDFATGIGSVNAYNLVTCWNGCGDQTNFTLSITIAQGNGTVSSAPSGINCPGTCSAGFVSGAQVTLTATAAVGWSFVGWGGACSGTGSCTVMMSAAESVSAAFSQIHYTIGLSASPSAGGTVGGAGTFPAGSSQTVTATANSGWSFANWTESGNVVSNSASYTFTLNANRTLVANFTAITHTIGLSASPSAGGTVGGAGTFPAGSSQTVTATANSGWSFASWTESGNVVSSSASYTFTLNANRTLVANFTEITYTIGLSASPSAGGTVSGDGTFPAGSSQTVTATANSGWSFANWTESGNVVSSSASYTFTLNANRTLVANFTEITYTIGLSASPSAGGTVGGAGTFPAGSSQTVTATANSGWSFANWTESGNVVSSSASYSFTLDSNRTLVANFLTSPETVLYSFKGPKQDGANVEAPLILGADGNFYGTTYQGGAKKRGTVFRLSPPVKRGSEWAETVLYSFGGGDGSHPVAGAGHGRARCALRHDRRWRHVQSRYHLPPDAAEAQRRAVDGKRAP